MAREFRIATILTAGFALAVIGGSAASLPAAAEVSGSGSSSAGFQLVTVSAAVQTEAGGFVPVATAATGPEVVELDLAGVDAQATSELSAVDAQSTERRSAVDPAQAPGLEVDNPIGALPDTAVTGVLTAKLSAAPFSVMGITWALDPALSGVIVQYRTFREGQWSEWGWAGPAEEYSEAEGNPKQTRGATDAIFVPDSTGVQIIVSSSMGTIQGVKAVLIDPGAGPEGTGASTSSGDPQDAQEHAATPDQANPTPATPSKPTDSPTGDSSVDPDDSTSTDSSDPGDGSGEPTPSQDASPTPTPSPTASTSTAPTDPTTPGNEGAQIAPSQSPAADGTGGGGVIASLATAVAPTPGIVSRAQWGAPAPVCSGGYATSTVAAAIHHTASSNSYTAAQVPGLLRGFAEYHMRPEAQGGRGWCDIGYNFLVDKFGTIYEGRAGGTTLPVIGVHTGGFNSRIVGVAAIGNYQDAVPSAALAESLSQIIAWKFAQYRILANSVVTMTSGGGASKFPAGTVVTFNTIFGHRDAQLTSCPGQYLYALFGDIRNRVAALSNQAVSQSPLGSWDLAASAVSAVRVAGWARDPESAGAINVQVLVDGVVKTTLTANATRSDVGAHGFDAKIAAAAGSHTVCLRWVNVGGGGNIMVGCRTITARNGNPVGALDVVRVTAAGAYVAGWARDPESKNPIDVHLYVNSTLVAWKANQPRPDVQKAAPSEAGPNHGFSGNLTLSPGKYRVCAYGINVGSGVNALVGCKDATVTGKAPAPANKKPFGSVDVVRATGAGRVQVAGWALDPDTTASIQTHIYVDGHLAKALAANGSRPDVAKAYGHGAAHGFDTTLMLSTGAHTVCSYAIDTTNIGNQLIACRAVTVVNKTPYGSLDLVQATGGGGVRVAGWALDPDTSASVQVHVYVDGKAVFAMPANGPRPDVEAAHNLGAAHGFDGSVRAAVGKRTICVYAIDTTGGGNPQIGCKVVTVR
jgi:N-acetylmuramoyl-L-alanine amidase